MAWPWRVCREARRREGSRKKKFPRRTSAGARAAGGEDNTFLYLYCRPRETRESGLIIVVQYPVVVGFLGSSRGWNSPHSNLEYQSKVELYFRLSQPLPSLPSRVALCCVACKLVKLLFQRVCLFAAHPRPIRNKTFLSATSHQRGLLPNLAHQQPSAPTLLPRQPEPLLESWLGLGLGLQ